MVKNEQSLKSDNLGNGQGYSVKETKEKETITKSESRIEDTPVFIANLQKIQQELGLYAEKNLQRIISDTWNGHQNKNFNF